MMSIITAEELTDKLRISFEIYPNMIIQEEIQGDEIRVLVLRGKVLLAGNRIPANVIGDGKSNIQELIDQENKNNDYRGEGYEKPLSFIKIDDELLSFIKKKDLTLKSILPKEKYIQLRGNSNIGTGGTMKDVTTTLSPQIKKTCIQASKIFGLNICGVDILTRDHTKPLEKNGGIILELNDTPGLGGDRELTGINTGKEILKSLFF